MVLEELLKEDSFRPDVIFENAACLSRLLVHLFHYKSSYLEPGTCDVFHYHPRGEELVENRYSSLQSDKGHCLDISKA